MESDSGETREVTATVELTGKYEQIAEILGRETSKYEDIGVVSNDMVTVLDIVASTGGATKSKIAAELPPDVAADLDAETVIHVLRVLELYELVTLDGNTWRPGPVLQ